MKKRISVLGILLAAASLAGCSIDEQGNLDINLVEQQAPEFTWQGAVRAGRTIEIKGVSGSIEATPAPGDQVKVLALRKGRSDPAKITIEVVEHEGGVTICAVYPTRPGEEPNVCKPGGEGRISARNYNASVTFKVQVPAGLGFVGKTTNGSVTATSLKGNIEARTVNGSVKFSTDGYGQASTTNGSINGSMGRADWTKTLEFETTNGSVHLQLPDTLQADVDATTVNGRVTVDFPITTRGEATRRHVEGVIGSGGRGLRVSSVNGSVSVGKRVRETS